VAVGGRPYRSLERRGKAADAAERSGERGRREEEGNQTEQRARVLRFRLGKFPGCRLAFASAASACGVLARTALPDDELGTGGWLLRRAGQMRVTFRPISG